MLKNFFSIWYSWLRGLFYSEPSDTQSINKSKEKLKLIGGFSRIIHKYLNEFKSVDIDNVIYGHISDEDKEIIIECSLYFAHAITCMHLLGSPVHIILKEHKILNSGNLEFVEEVESIVRKIRNQEAIDRFEFEFILTILTFSKAMLEIKEMGGKICAVTEDGCNQQTIN